MPARDGHPRLISPARETPASWALDLSGWASFDLPRTAEARETDRRDPVAMRTAPPPAGQEGHGLPAVVLALVLVALALGLLGGAVPALAHQVAAGRLPDALEPEQYLGAPTAFSVSGPYALLGSAIWATTACAALFLYRRAGPGRPVRTLSLLGKHDRCEHLAKVGRLQHSKLNNGDFG